MYRKSADSMRASSSSPSWSLRGNTNHDPKKAGTNHGSHRIDPAAVSIRIPAWPREVAVRCFLRRPEDR